MNREQNSPDSDDIRKLGRLMQINMRKNALYHFKHINIRTLRILQHLNLFRGEVNSIPEVEISVLLDPQHPRREPLPAGPLVAYVTEDETPKRVILEFPILLFSGSPDVRRAALECLTQVIHGNNLAITPKTRNVIENSRDLLMSGDPINWRPAAVTLSDALFDDVLFALLGTRQCIEGGQMLADALPFYASKVFQPTISSLDSITLDIGDPEAEHEKMSKVIGQVVSRAQSLTEACEEYYEKLGYLPLAPRYGMAKTVRDWRSGHPDTDVWTQVWDWAHAAFGPLPRYHACSVFISYPELVPQGKLPELWREIADIIQGLSNKEVDADPGEAWKLRRDLQLQYIYHIEARLPDGNGANIACFAWWFSEQVATLFEDTPAAI